jgi:hypothetical protein
MYRKILITLASAAAAALVLSGCVESQTPLITDARPLLGQRFEVHLYEDFVEGKATDFHTANYHWQDGQYVRGSGAAHDAKYFVAQSLVGNDFLLQSSDDREKPFYYWIGRKLAVGVYMIFPLDETDADDATRVAICGKDRPAGYCPIRSSDQLLTLARTTAAKPIQKAALGVVLMR